jgi:hypothetical protein
MLQVRLYMKRGCHLCEDALAELQRVQGRWPHVVEQIDITAEAELLQRYGLRIPVLAVGGCEFDAPLTRPDIETALRYGSIDAGDGASVEAAPKTPSGSKPTPILSSTRPSATPANTIASASVQPLTHGGSGQRAPSAASGPAAGSDTGQNA